MKENSPDNYDLATSWRWKLIDGIHCWMTVLYLLLRGASHAIIIVTTRTRSCECLWDISMGT